MDPAELPPDENRGPALNAIAWVGAGIATVFVILRLISRIFVTKSPGWDDAIIVAAMILNNATIALGSVSIHYGVGRHLGYLEPEQITNALYYLAVQRPPGIMSYCLPKLSVVILLVKLMGNAKRGVWQVWSLYSIIVVLFVTSILSFIIFFVRCTPTSSLWEGPEGATCFPEYVLNNITYFAGSWSAFTDIVLASFPIYLLWNLQMKKSRKITAMTIMALGFLASIAAIAKTTQLSINNSTDATWESFWLFIASYLESDLVIIAACAPTVPKLVNRLRGKDDETTKASSSGFSSGYPAGSKPASHGYREFDSHVDSQNELVTMDQMRRDDPSP